MKKHFLKSFALLAMLFSALTMSAATYCSESMKSNVGWDGNYQLSAEKVSETQSRLTITALGEEVITGFYQFIIQNLGGGAATTTLFDPGAAEFSNPELFDVAADGKSAIININWTTYPTGNVGVHMILRRNNSSGGSDIFGNTITDLDLSATCSSTSEGGEDTDTETPVLESVELFGAAQNFVLLSPNATDNKGVTSYLITPNGGAEKEVTLDNAGKIKIEGLTLDKSYTYSVKAKDAAGNVSAAKEITFSTLDRIFCEEEILPNVQFTTNQKLTFTAKKVSNTETLFTLTSSTSTLTKMFNVNLTNAGSGVLPAGYVWKDDWTLTDNTLSKTVTWETYPTNPITIAITANRTPGAGENNLIGLSYSMDISNTCGEEPTPEPEETIIAETYFAPGWVVDPTSSATYDANTGTITVDIKNALSSQWQGQVKVKHDVAFSADKQYTLSCKFHATAAVNGVTIKMDDNQDNPVLFENASLSLPANEDYIYTSAPSNGKAGNNQILVFDFGWAPACQITISDITIQEVVPTPEEPETPSVVYCDFPTGHTGDANFGDANGRILVSLIKKSETSVRLVVKSADAATKNLDLLYVEAAGANPGAITEGSDVAEGDLREMFVDITYPTAPAKYSFMIQWSNPDWDGRWQINLNDVLESNLCPLPTDDEAPVMVSASLVTGSETYNSAVLTVSATDNDEVANYHVVDATNDYNATIAPVGNQITLTDLTPSTTYNFTVTALDLAGNESENSKTVAVSTHKLEYCEWIIGSENRIDWTDANRLCLLTISKITDKQLLVVAKPVSGANKLDFLQVQADGAPHQTVTSPAADELSIVLDFENTITEIPLFRILWSNEGVDPNWMTDLKNVKASYLCSHVELGESVDLSKLDLSAGVTTDVKITRKFVKGSGKWNTLSLPFGLDAADIATAFGSAKVVELSGATLVTSTDIDLSVSNVSEIVAGKPYLIQIPASYAPAVIENITLSNTVTAQETATANGLAKMVSVLTPIEFNDAAGGIRFFLNTNGKLSYRSTTNGIMNPYRAYFEFPHINDPATASQVRARVVFNENTETGVDNLITTDAPVKVIENGQLIIIRGGVKYNVQGQKL